MRPQPARSWKEGAVPAAQCPANFRGGESRFHAEREKIMRTGLTLLFAASAMLVASGCNTMAGAGQDVQSAGRGIENAAVKSRVALRENWQKTEADYKAARMGCGSMAEPQRAACYDRARAEYRTHANEARLRYEREVARRDAEEDRMIASYWSARERCETLREADEQRCIDEAWARYRR